MSKAKKYPNRPTADGVNWFNTAQVAKLFGYSVDTVKTHIYRIGDLKPDYRDARCVMFRKDTLDNFIPRDQGRPKRTA